MVAEGACENGSRTVVSLRHVDRGRRLAGIPPCHTPQQHPAWAPVIATACLTKDVDRKILS